MTLPCLGGMIIKLVMTWALKFPQFWGGFFFFFFFGGALGGSVQVSHRDAVSPTTTPSTPLPASPHPPPPALPTIPWAEIPQFNFQKGRREREKKKKRRTILTLTAAEILFRVESQRSVWL